MPAGHGRATPVASELAQLLNSMEKAGPRIVISPARFATALKFAALQHFSDGGWRVIAA